MKRRPYTAAQAQAQVDLEHFFGFGSGKIVVANRGSGSISVIATAFDQLIATIDLPEGQNAPEPMYVVYT